MLPSVQRVLFFGSLSLLRSDVLMVVDACSSSNALRKAELGNTAGMTGERIGWE